MLLFLSFLTLRSIRAFLRPCRSQHPFLMWAILSLTSTTGLLACTGDATRSYDLSNQSLAAGTQGEHAWAEYAEASPVQIGALTIARWGLKPRAEKIEAYQVLDLRAKNSAGAVIAKGALLFDQRLATASASPTEKQILEGIRFVFQPTEAGQQELGAADQLALVQALAAAANGSGQAITKLASSAPALAGSPASAKALGAIASHNTIANHTASAIKNSSTQIAQGSQITVGQSDAVTTNTAEWLCGGRDSGQLRGFAAMGRGRSPRQSGRLMTSKFTALTAACIGGTTASAAVATAACMKAGALGSFFGGPAGAAVGCVAGLTLTALSITVGCKQSAREFRRISTDYSCELGANVESLDGRSCACNVELGGFKNAAYYANASDQPGQARCIACGEGTVWNPASQACVCPTSAANPTLRKPSEIQCWSEPSPQDPSRLEIHRVASCEAACDPTQKMSFVTARICTTDDPNLFPSEQNQCAYYAWGPRGSVTPPAMTITASNFSVRAKQRCGDEEKVIESGPAGAGRYRVYSEIKLWSGYETLPAWFVNARQESYNLHIARHQTGQRFMNWKYFKIPDGMYPGGS